MPPTLLPQLVFCGVIIPHFHKKHQQFPTFFSLNITQIVGMSFLYISIQIYLKLKKLKS